MFTLFCNPKPEPIGEAKGIIAEAPLSSSFFANKDELSTNLSAPHINIARDAPKARKFIRKSIMHFTLVIIQIDYVSIIKSTI